MGTSDRNSLDSFLATGSTRPIATLSLLCLMKRSRVVLPSEVLTLDLLSNSDLRLRWVIRIPVHLLVDLDAIVPSIAFVSNLRGHSTLIKSTCRQSPLAPMLEDPYRDLLPTVQVSLLLLLPYSFDTKLWLGTTLNELTIMLLLMHLLNL